MDKSNGSEFPKLDLEMKNKEIIREHVPIYTCSNIRLNSQEVESIYDNAMKEIINGERNTEMGYLYGMGIMGQDLTEEEKQKILEATGTILKEKGVAFEKCYIDICDRGNGNFGLYFNDQSQLNTAKHILGDDLKLTFIADIQEDGKYKIRGENGGGVGHNTNEPHLIADGSLEL